MFTWSYFELVVMCLINYTAEYARMLSVGAESDDVTHTHTHTRGKSWLLGLDARVTNLLYQNIHVLTTSVYNYNKHSRNCQPKTESQVFLKPGPCGCKQKNTRTVMPSLL